MLAGGHEEHRIQLSGWFHLTKLSVYTKEEEEYTLMQREEPYSNIQAWIESDLNLFEICGWQGLLQLNILEDSELSIQNVDKKRPEMMIEAKLYTGCFDLSLDI